MPTLIFPAEGNIFLFWPSSASSLWRVNCPLCITVIYRYVIVPYDRIQIWLSHNLLFCLVQFHCPSGHSRNLFDSIFSYFCSGFFKAVSENKDQSLECDGVFNINVHQCLENKSQCFACEEELSVYQSIRSKFEFHFSQPKL